MRQQTFNRIEKAWDKLPSDHLFKDWEQFLEVAEQLGEVTEDGRSYYYSRKRTNEPFGPGNLKLIYVATPYDWDDVYYPAI